MPRTVALFIVPDFQILDLTGPLSAFDMAGGFTAPRPYRPVVISPGGGLVGCSSGLEVASHSAAGVTCDTLVVVGGRGPRRLAADPEVVFAIRSVAAGARRVVSVCSGAFVLAEAGLLDGRRATTHWRHAARLQRDFPAVRVEADRIFVRDGPVWTSAGITAGIDLALALIEEDVGAAVSRAVARELVVEHRRPGGQSQFSTMLDLEPDSDRIRRALAHAREHLAEPLPVERLARAACLSQRQFGRAFRAETGETPAKAVERLRAEAARPRVEEGLEPIERIAETVGFTDPERMRRAFLRLYGQPPQALRRAARRVEPVV